MNFFESKMTPPPLGLFPKKHKNLGTRSSLRFLILTWTPPMSQNWWSILYQCHAKVSDGSWCSGEMCNVTGLHNSKAAIRHNLNPVEAGGEASAAIKAAEASHFFFSYLFLFLLSVVGCWTAWMLKGFHYSLLATPHLQKGLNLVCIGNIASWDDTTWTPLRQESRCQGREVLN